MIEAIVEIAKALIKDECPNWSWELINTNLKRKYITKAERVYFVIEKLGYKKEK